MAEMDDLRKNLPGYSFPYDRLWRISGPGFMAVMTDYNWEVTGAAAALSKWIKYGDNAYYFLFTVCPREGFGVEKVNDRPGD